MQKSPSENPGAGLRPSATETVGLRGRLKAIARAPGEALALAVVLLVGGFFLLWRIDQLPPNLVDEPLGGAIAAWMVVFQKEVIAATVRAIDQTHGGGPLDLAFLGQNSLEWLSAWGYLNIYPMAYPLGVIIAATSMTLLGSSLAVFVGVSATLGLLSVLATYVLGRRLYGPWVGLLAALFLATSFYFVGYLRGPTFTLAKPLATLLAVLFMYCLYRGTETRRAIYWWLLGVIGGLAIFNGWMVSLLLPGIALLFLLVNTNWRDAWRRSEGQEPPPMERLFKLLRLLGRGLVRYGAVLVLALALGVLLSVLWSLYLGLEPLATLRGIYQIAGQAQASAASLAPTGARLSNLRLFWKAAILGNPEIMEPALELLLFLGIGTCLWKRSAADRLLLSWLLVGFATFALVVRYGAPKYLITVFPGICLTAARPLAAALERALKIRVPFRVGFHALPLLLFAPLVTLWLIWNGAQTYNRYFVQQKALAFSADYSQIARVLESASPAEPAAIVYPDYIADMPFQVSFHFPQRPFRFFSWRSAEVPRSKVWVSFNTFEPERIAEWERLMLSRYVRIFYLVPQDEPWYQESFASLHPGLAPIGTVESLVALDVYEVTTAGAAAGGSPETGQLLVENPESRSIISFQETNLLQNGSFEDWDKAVPAGWRLFSATGASSSLVKTGEAQDGSAALTIRPSALSQTVYQDFTRGEGVSHFTGKTITFGVWARSQEPHARIHLQFRADDNETVVYRIFDVTPTYQLYWLTMPDPPAAATRYRVEIMAGDDFSFNEVTIDSAVLVEGPYCWDGFCSNREIGNALEAGVGTATLRNTTFAKGPAGQAVPVLPGEGYQAGSSRAPEALTTAANLLQNPSFETWTRDLEADAWRSFYATPEPLGLSRETNSHSGQYAVRLKPSGLSQALYQDFTQREGVGHFIGKSVTFGLWARSAAPTGVMRLHMRRDNNYTEKVEHFRLTNEYQFFSMTVDRLSEATMGYRVEIIPGNESANNDILVDDAVVIVEEK